MNIEWNSQEVNHDYPDHWNKGPYLYNFTPTEELIIEKAKEKWHDYKKEEPMMPRERAAKNYFTNEPTDRIPMLVDGTTVLMVRIFDSFADPPSTLSQRDMENHPNLDFVGQMLWLAKWPITDYYFPYNFGFGEEMMCRKFRFIENGPPLAVEPFMKTKEDALWFLDNVPDHAIRGACWPTYFWITKMGVKYVPDAINFGSCCGGQITMAGIFRGIKDFVMDVRNNPEMAELAIKCATAMLQNKFDIMSDILVQQFDETGEGNQLLWCDSTSYLSVDEMKKLMPITYEVSIPMTARKGYAPFIVPEGPLGAHELINKTLNENLGGGIIALGSHPAVEDWYPVTRKYDNIIAWINTNSTVFLQPQSVILDQIKLYANMMAKYPTKGQRTIFMDFADPTAPLANVEFGIKKAMELFKSPVQPV